VPLVVRLIAFGDLTAPVQGRVRWKEMWLGLTTGLANALSVDLIARRWKGQVLLALMLGLARVFNMIVAAVVGPPDRAQDLQERPRDRVQRDHHDIRGCVRIFLVSRSGDPRHPTSLLATSAASG
jgi:hypothetical protein